MRCDKTREENEVSTVNLLTLAFKYEIWVLTTWNLLSLIRLWLRLNVFPSCLRHKKNSNCYIWSLCPTNKRLRKKSCCTHWLLTDYGIWCWGGIQINQGSVGPWKTCNLKSDFYDSLFILFINKSASRMTSPTKTMPVAFSESHLMDNGHFVVELKTGSVTRGRGQTQR